MPKYHRCKERTSGTSADVPGRRAEDGVGLKNIKKKKENKKMRDGKKEENKRKNEGKKERKKEGKRERE